MKEKNKIELYRNISKSELRHIVNKIWGLEIDYDMLRENEETDNFYEDAENVILAEMSLNDFANEYIGEDIFDIDFSIVYDTLDYLKKRKITQKKTVNGLNKSRCNSLDVQK